VAAIRRIVAWKAVNIQIMNLSLLQGGKSAFVFGLLALNAAAGTLYVDINGTNPVSPYGDWSTAATNIQDAVDAATTGDLVLVNDGVYQSGGTLLDGISPTTNRVAITKAVTVQSVSGPASTMICGYQVPGGTTNGPSAIRCVYLADGAVLAGFTITNGATSGDNGGGVLSVSTAGVVSNCLITGNSAPSVGGGACSNSLIGCTLIGNRGTFGGGGAAYATLTNCTLTGNWAGGAGGGGAYAAILNGCIVLTNSGYSGGGANACNLTNCTLIGNLASGGAGAYQSTLRNCNLTGNSAGSVGGGAHTSTLVDCTLTGNASRQYGGGARGGTLTNCTLTGNSASVDGGGAYSSTLTNCTLSGNVAAGSGGGAISSTLSQCTLTGNSAAYGGGAHSGTLYNCTLAGNAASMSGGGAYSAILNNCVLFANSAQGGGGAGVCTLNNCTLTGNSASTGGGTAGGTLNNCIVYYNWARSALGDPSSSNYNKGTLRYCCTAPLPQSGTGNISADPQLASASHLSAASPCRGAGSAAYASGTDIDGQSWASPPSIGCDEFYAGSITGNVSISIQADYTNLFPGMTATFTGSNLGQVNASRWEFDDGTTLSNRPYTTRSWAAPGTYPVVLRAYDDSNPQGATATIWVQVGSTTVHYVAQGNLTPQAPYTSWTTAATNIQDAVDAASSGDQVLVSNGLYQTGARVDSESSSSNRLVVPRPLLVQSVSGSEATVIKGYQSPGIVNDSTSVRCVYLWSGAWLVGFTLTNGATGLGGLAGGALCPADGSAVILNCVLAGNSARNGGGACGGTLKNCVVTGNTALGLGGGTYQSVLNNSLVSSNRASVYSIGNGGGAYSGSLSNCVVVGNSAAGYGGGTYGAGLYNCAVVGNSAVKGGGVCGPLPTAINCTIIANTASAQGGGTYAALLRNCIVYYNSAPSGPNYSSGNLSYCCATPLPGGSGNISGDPQLAGLSHISAQSPCRGAGSAAYASGTDIDGETWANPPSMGCDESYAGSVTGPLSVTIQADFTNLMTGWPGNFTANLNGRLVASRWDFGDGTVMSNRPYASHAWSTAGTYAVVLSAWNDSNPAGLAATQMVCVVTQDVHYVAINNPAPQPPYDSWQTAATNLQDAVDATAAGGQVLVSNGVYATGGRVMYGAMSNRLAVWKPMSVSSINGPAVTIIRGYQVPGTTNWDGAVRCVYLTSGASLVGFTLTNGATRAGGDQDFEQSGGGVWCVAGGGLSNCVLTGNSVSAGGGGAYGGSLTNCLLTSNSAQGTGPAGGGACYSTLWNCLIMSNKVNSSVQGNGQGGGAFGGSLNNCTVIGNAAPYGGSGTYLGTLNDCIIYYNSGGDWSGGTLSYCCTTTLPSGGGGSFTNAPLFVDRTSGNFRLQATSPCINAGLNAHVINTTDLDGNSRISGGTVDVGAYEFQNPASAISYAWLQQFGFPMDGTADTVDSDHDGMNNGQEWRAGTDPTNSLSVLQMLAPTNGASGVTVTWQSVTNRGYYLQRSVDLSVQPAFLNLQSNIVGQAGTTSYTDTNAVGAGPLFYRIGVQ
jgi:hypothetical protein